MKTLAHSLATASLAFSALSCRPPLPQPTLPLVRTPDAPFRASAPPPLAPRAVAWPVIERFVLANGLTVVHIPRAGDAAMASVRFVCRRCGDEDPNAPAGLATLAARWVSGSSLGLSDSTMQRSIGPRFRLDHSVDHDMASLAARVDTAQIPLAIARIAHQVREQPEDVNHFERVRGAMLQNRLESNAGLDAELAMSSIWGETHPYGRPITGDATQLQRITFDQVRTYAREHYVPNESALIVAGEISRGALEGLANDAFGSWTNTPIAAPPPLPAARAAQHPVFVHTSRSLAAQILVALPGVHARSDDYMPMLVLDTLLAGLFTSRTNTSLREERGYTYGTHSETRAYRGGGSLVVGAEVSVDRAVDAVRQLLTEFDRLRASPPTNDELTAARETWRAQLGAGFERADSATELVGEWFVHDRPLDLREATLAIQRVDAASVHRVAQSLLARERAHIVMFADRERVGGAFRRAFGETDFLVFLR